MKEVLDETEEGLYEIMAKNFVPVNLTNLYKDYFESDIICSLIGGGLLRVARRNGYKQYKWITHILLLKNGIAFKDKDGINSFLNWKSTDVDMLRFKSHSVHFHFEKHEFKFHVGKTVNKPFKHKITGERTRLYNEETFIVIQKNFANFCKLLANKHRLLINEMADLARDNELIKKKITDIGIEEFCKNIRWLNAAGFERSAFNIIENALKCISMEYRKEFLYLRAVLYTRKASHLFDQFKNNEIKIKNTVIPCYQMAIDSYNQVLELDPSYTDALDWIKNIHLKIEYYNVPMKIRNKGYDFLVRGFRLYRLKKYEKALKLLKKSYEINPIQPADTLAEYIIKTLHHLGRYNEINEYLKEYIFRFPEEKEKLLKKLSLQVD